MSTMTLSSGSGWLQTSDLQRHRVSLQMRLLLLPPVLWRWSLRQPRAPARPSLGV